MEWLVFWGAWGAVFLLSFAYFEVRGYADRGTHGTLSNFIWFLLFHDWEAPPRRKPRFVVWLPVLGFWIWLSVHFFAGGVI